MEDISSNSQVFRHSLRAIFTLLFLTLFTASFCQPKLSTTSKKAEKLYVKAEKKYNERAFTEAILLLEEATRLDTGFYEAYLRMGSLHRAMGQEDSTYIKFQKYAAKAPVPQARVLEMLALMAFDRGQYTQSEIYLRQFLTSVPEKRTDPELILLSKSIDFAKIQIDQNTDRLIADPLPNEVNKFKLQYLPSLTVDNQSIFYTKRTQETGDEDIVVSRKSDGKWMPAQPVSTRINSRLNEGACTVSADGKTMIFTMCEARNSLGSCDLYISRFTRGDWSYPKNLGKVVNTIYWDSQPSLSADGKKLYFSSNRRGGYGGRDIWVTEHTNGQWTQPINLGKSINTAKDETTPFIHSNGSSLYFSANGYPGMGGYDLFVSNKRDTTWSLPKNLGYPINTYKDEVSIVISSDGQTGIYALEEQKNHQIVKSNLVSIPLPTEAQAQPVSYIVGRVYDSDTKKPLSAKVEVVNLSSDRIVYRNSSDDYSGSFLMVLPAGLDLAAYIKKEGYLYTDIAFETNNNNVSRPDTIDVALKPVKVGESLILKNIYFESNAYKLNERSQSELQNAFELLQQNPTLVAEIAGHTDNVGTGAYNMQLSKKRAAAIYDELLNKGIDPRRLSFEGYAATQPLKPNTSADNRKSNRRIEFRVLRMK